VCGWRRCEMRLLRWGQLLGSGWLRGNGLMLDPWRLQCWLRGMRLILQPRRLLCWLRVIDLDSLIRQAMCGCCLQCRKEEQMEFMTRLKNDSRNEMNLLVN
jgi:hypothetical protein